MERKVVTEESGIHKEWYERAKKVSTIAELTAFATEMREDYQHDYGTICHAITATAIAAMWAVERSPQGGITGFQASCIMWGLIDHWNVFDKGPKRMVCYRNMLYPQYADKFDKLISQETWEYLQEEAAKEIKEAHPQINVASPVYQHWQSIVAGQVPFGYRVVSKEGE
jgi:hypothetical protein